MDKQKKQLIELLDAFKADIPFFAKTVFDVEMRPKQIEFAKAFQENQLITFKGGVGFGKTTALAIITWW